MLLSDLRMLSVQGLLAGAAPMAEGASPPSRQLVGTLALTLSNLLFLPAVALAVKRRLLAEALIYLATTLFSILYHACDEPEYSFCVTKYEVRLHCLC